MSTGPTQSASASASQTPGSHSTSTPPAQATQQTPTRFSPEAINEYASRTSDYLVSLEQMSRIIAKQKSSDDVSAHHVRVAAETLGTGGQRKYKRMAELGMLLSGGGLGYAGNVVVASAYTFGNALIAFVPVAVGCGLYFFSIGQE